MDMVVGTDHIPKPGETLLSHSFFMAPGGKGANQAISAARLGGRVSFISKTGRDLFGKQALARFRKEGIDTTYVLTDEESASGVALITVSETGENSIVVAPGANSKLFPQNIEPAQNMMAGADVVLMQLEIPLETVQSIADLDALKKAKLILDPAPARELPDGLFEKIDLMTPNKSEAESLTGMAINSVDEAQKAAKLIHKKGTNRVIITMGRLGAVLCENGETQPVHSPDIKAVDSTAAGDVFNGALAVGLSENRDLKAAVKFANKAAAISVTQKGAVDSIPYRKEL